jgi:hypothetical protein
MESYGLDSRRVVGSFAYSIEPSGSIKCSEVIG